MPAQTNAPENLRTSSLKGATGGKTKEIHNLDILRSIAVTLVLIDHTTWALGHHLFSTWFGSWETADIGVFGVYLFFVHTSLVLMWSMERQPNILNFYIRRAFRIYPLAIVAILTALIFRIPVSAGGIGYVWTHFTFKTIVANLLLLQNLIYAPNIVGVMWTLTLEVQMYLVLPALFLLAVHEKRIWQLVLLWALVVAVNHAYGSSTGNTLPMVVPVFLSGVIAYIAFQKFQPVLPAWNFVVFLFVLLTIYMYSPTPARAWPIALALALMLPVFKQIRNPLVVSIGHNVAKYSYGIYLWHTFGLKLSFHFMPWNNNVAKVAVELILTAIASVAGYHLIEAPMIGLGSRWARANENRLARRSARAFSL